MFEERYASAFSGDERWQQVPTTNAVTYDWDPTSTYVKLPPYFDGLTMEPGVVTDFSGARVLAKLGDSVTTDHISPAGNIRASSPAGRYLIDGGVAPGRLQQLRHAPREPRDHGARHVRQHPHPQPDGARAPRAA